MTESKTKTTNPARIVILVLLGVTLLAGTLLLALTVMTYVQMQKAMQWSPDDVITQEEKERYAGLAMIPEVTDYIDRVYIRGIRDPQYCIMTASFDSIDELYAVLPYESEEELAAAIAAISEPLTDLPEMPEGTEIYNMYYAEGMPYTETDGDGYAVSYYYTHANYILENSDGYCLVFFVQTH